MPQWHVRDVMTTEVVTAGVDTSVPVTISPDASLPAAAREMYRGNVGWLLVVGDDGRPRGIVSRSDLLKVHGRPDAAIRDEVQQLLHRTLGREGATVQVTVDNGVVTLVGRIARRTTAQAAVSLPETVAGVTGVVDEVAFDLDDTVVPTATSRSPDPDPFHGTWTWHRPKRAVRRTTGERPLNQYGQPAPRSAARNDRR